MGNLRAAVIGVGYLGNFHAQKYSQIEGVDLHAVVDTDPDRGREVAVKHGVFAVADFREIIDDIDLVSIVVPPAYHYEIAHECLRTGVHTLVEKPVTETVDQAEELIRLADEGALIFQVGHLERFNPVVRALRERITTPRLIEAQRFAEYQTRGTDIDVVLDLMIHDIDIVLNLVDSPMVAVQSSGTAVITQSIDIAHARLEFADGCVAELSASRVSREPTRAMKVYQDGSYLSIDYMNHDLHIGTAGEGGEEQDHSELTFETQNLIGSDVLMDEISSFVDAVRSGSQPEVTGEDGKRALEVAIEVSHRINRYRAANTVAPNVEDN